MADIELKCPKCAKIVTVSEFADLDGMTCNACGEQLKKPESTAKKEKQKPSLKLADLQPEAETSGSIEPTKWQISQDAAKKKRPKPKFEMTHLLWSSIIFLVLGGIMGYLRYAPDGFLATNKDLVRTYGPIILLTMHIIIVLGAFKDSVFQGVLCLLIPLYSMYYLFNVSDNFYLRAVTAVFLIGLGQDSAIVFSEWSQVAFNYVNDFISSGGGGLQSVPRK
ncbi:MAG: hypothetical protein A2283_00810 [Lentisphaerae bacterium RIFOXYA12_FULL_48_11]|nr:MAG: hypothetical protein A2283_00810 [Lentisphaerae bacterium RIFOXYA12_FULL_48_11]